MSTDIATQEQQIAENPFAMPKDPRLNAGTIAVESSRAATEVVAALKIAQQFPRDEEMAYERIMRTCGRLEFATSATYSYPRGGETISGPSIRLAEEMARAWGNLEFGIRELAVYDDKETEMEAYCWDMQTNVRSKQTFRAEHVRFTRSNGRKQLDDPRDIYENNANLGARRLRSRILAIIPPDLVNEALRRCRETITRSVSDAKTLSERIPTMLKKFDKLGVTEKLIEYKIKHKVATMSADDYADLCGIYKSIEDGQTSAADWFNLPKGTTTSEAAKALNDAVSGDGGESDSSKDTKPEDGQLI